MNFKIHEDDFEVIFERFFILLAELLAFCTRILLGPHCALSFRKFKTFFREFRLVKVFFKVLEFAVGFFKHHELYPHGMGKFHVSGVVLFFLLVFLFDHTVNRLNPITDGITQCHSNTSHINISQLSLANVLRNHIERTKARRLS